MQISWGLRRFLLGAAMLLAALPLRADRLKMAGEQKPVSIVFADRFETWKGKAHFFLRTEDDPATEPLPVEADLVERVDFAPPGAPEPKPGDAATSRCANLELTNGSKFERVYVTAFLRENGQPNFIIYEHADTKPEDAFPVDAAIVKLLRFESLAPKATPAPVETPVRSDDAPTSMVMPERTPFVTITPEPVEPEIPLIPDARTLLGGGLDGSAGSSVDVSKIIEAPPTKKWHLGPIHFMVFIVLATAVGMLQLLGIAKKEKLKNVTKKRAFWTALALAVVPLSLLWLGKLLVNWIGGLLDLASAEAALTPIGFIFGLAAAWFSLRAILMGSLEVLDEKGNSVTFNYAAIQAVILMIVLAVV